MKKVIHVSLFQQHKECLTKYIFFTVSWVPPFLLLQFHPYCLGIQSYFKCKYLLASVMLAIPKKVEFASFSQSHRLKMKFSRENPDFWLLMKNGTVQHCWAHISERAQCQVGGSCHFDIKHMLSIHQCPPTFHVHTCTLVLFRNVSEVQTLALEFGGCHQYPLYCTASCL